MRFMNWYNSDKILKKTCLDNMFDVKQSCRSVKQYRVENNKKMCRIKHNENKGQRKRQTIKNREYEVVNYKAQRKIGRKIKNTENRKMTIFINTGMKEPTENDCKKVVLMQDSVLSVVIVSVNDWLKFTYDFKFCCFFLNYLL